MAADCSHPAPMPPSGPLFPRRACDVRSLSLIPGCQLDAWMSDYAMPERPVAPEEQVWSNMMKPTAAAKLLEQDP